MSLDFKKMIDILLEQKPDINLEQLKELIEEKKAMAVEQVREVIEKAREESRQLQAQVTSTSVMLANKTDYLMQLQEKLKSDNSAALAIRTRVPRPMPKPSGNRKARTASHQRKQRITSDR